MDRPNIPSKQAQNEVVSEQGSGGGTDERTVDTDPYLPGVLC